MSIFGKLGLKPRRGYDVPHEGQNLPYLGESVFADVTISMTDVVRKAIESSDEFPHSDPPNWLSEQAKGEFLNGIRDDAMNDPFKRDEWTLDLMLRDIGRESPEIIDQWRQEMLPVIRQGDRAVRELYGLAPSVSLPGDFQELVDTVLVLELTKTLYDERRGAVQSSEPELEAHRETVLSDLRSLPVDQMAAVVLDFARSAREELSLNSRDADVPGETAAAARLLCKYIPEIAKSLGVSLEQDEGLAMSLSAPVLLSATRMDERQASDQMNWMAPRLSPNSMALLSQGDSQGAIALLVLRVASLSEEQQVSKDQAVEPRAAKDASSSSGALASEAMRWGRSGMTR